MIKLTQFRVMSQMELVLLSMKIRLKIQNRQLIQRGKAKERREEIPLITYGRIRARSYPKKERVKMNSKLSRLVLLA